ncbi:transposase, partial [Aerococcaceae bacterium zg-ZJ1578]|nr:transposase [Aerococcaceae bacterium zg-1578]
LTSTKMSSKRVLELYRNKDLVEKSFHYLKDRLSGRRMRVSPRRTLEGKLFVQYIALVLNMYIKKAMEEYQLFEHYTMNQLISLIGRIERLEHPKYGVTMGEVLEKQLELLKKLEIPAPC